jgi:DNA-directed RNA polymerase subunit RPC12/RpoP
LLIIDWSDEGMFYLKIKMPNGKTVRTDITDENVYTRCPECGRELPVDLAELFSDGDGDLYSTSILCSACSSKRVGKRKFMDGMQITADGLALVSDILCKAGYGEQVYDLFNRFEADDITELTPEQYKPFADALSRLVIMEGAL